MRPMGPGGAARPSAFGPSDANNSKPIKLLVFNVKWKRHVPQRQPAKAMRPAAVRDRCQ
jgi:hypothetical protein